MCSFLTLVINLLVPEMSCTTIKSNIMIMQHTCTSDFLSIHSHEKQRAAKEQEKFLEQLWVL